MAKLYFTFWRRDHPFHDIWCKIISIGLLWIGMTGCGPSSLKDFHIEGDAICRALVRDLNRIHSQEELVQSIPLLTTRFNQIVDLIIEARMFQQKHPEEEDIATALDHHQLLQQALQRVYAMDGGREALEKAEREALFRLDAFEKKLAKQQARRRTVRP